MKPKCSEDSRKCVKIQYQKASFLVTEIIVSPVISKKRYQNSCQMSETVIWNPSLHAMHLSTKACVTASTPTRVQSEVTFTSSQRNETSKTKKLNLKETLSWTQWLMERNEWSWLKCCQHLSSEQV